VEIKIKEFMTTRIESIGFEKSVYDAVERMVDRRIRSLVVRFPGNDQDNGVVALMDVMAVTLIAEAQGEHVF
jgi:predicted transcriptional regulator